MSDKLPDHTPGRDRVAIVVASGDYKSVDPANITIDTHNSDTLRLGVDVTAVSGSGATVTVTINGIDKDGDTYQLLQKAITTTGVTEMVISPGIPTSSGVALQAPTPEHVQVTMVGSGTRTTLTYSVSAEVS